MIGEDGGWLGFSAAQWGTLEVLVAIGCPIVAILTWGACKFSSFMRLRNERKADAIAAQVRAREQQELEESQARLRGDRGFREMMLERERIDPDWGWTDVTEHFFSNR